MPGLLYATPSGKSPRIEYVISMRAHELTIKSFVRGVKDFNIASAPVQMARSRLASEARAGKYEFVLMHDDDLVVSPHDLGGPIDAWHSIFDEHKDVGVIGAVYLRECPAMPNVVIPHPVYTEELCHVIAGFPDNPVDVGAIATGFMMIRVSVLDALAEAEDHAPAFQFRVIKNRWGSMNEVGEDYDFCTRVRGLGFRVLADPRINTVHCKDRGPLGFDRERWEKRWSDGDHVLMSELRGNCPKSFQLLNHNGFVLLDHTAEKALQAKARKEEIAA